MITVATYGGKGEGEREKRKKKTFNLHRPPFFSSFEFRRYSDLCPDRATMATIFSLGSPLLPGETVANKESSLHPHEKKGKKAKKVDTRISDAPLG